MFDFAVLIDIFDLRLQFEGLFIFEEIILSLFNFGKFSDGDDFGEIEGFMVGSHFINLMLELFGNQSAIDIGAGFEDAHFGANLKILGFFSFIEKEITPGELEIDPYLKIVHVMQPSVS